MAIPCPTLPCETNTSHSKHAFIVKHFENLPVYSEEIFAVRQCWLSQKANEEIEEAQLCMSSQESRGC